MNNARQNLDRLIGEREYLRKTIVDTHNKLDGLDQELYCQLESKELIQKAAQLTQQYLEKNLSSIVTQALQIVFEDVDLGFVVRFVTKRNSTECEMFLTEDGEEYDPLNSSGFGAADVISFALRVAMWSLNKTRNTLIVDEPFRNLDDVRMPQASLMLATLSEELKLQMIVVTHENSLTDNADRVFHVQQKKGISSVTVVR